MFQLAQGASVSLRGAKGARIVACRGVVWLTEQGRYQDLFLGPGQAVTLASSGLAIVSAESNAAFALIDAPGNWRTRLAQRVAGLVARTVTGQVLGSIEIETR